MSYDDIFLFIRLIEIGTFSALARSLNTTQGTISRRIKKLEQDLDVQLLTRSSRGPLEMTEDGQLLYDRFSKQEQQLGVALEEIIKLQKSVKGILRISVPLQVFNKIIQSNLLEFQDRYPMAKLVISYNGGSVDLLKDNYDIAVSMRIPKSQNTKIKLLKKTKIKLFASCTYGEKYGIPDSLNELINHHVAGHSVDGTMLSMLQATNIKTNVDELVNYEPSIFINNALHNIDLALSGSFIISAADIFVQNGLIFKELVPVLPDYYFGETNYFLVRRNAVHSRLEMVFAQFIQDCFDRVI